MSPLFLASPSPSFDFYCELGGYMRAQLWAEAQNKGHVVGPFLHPPGPALCGQLRFPMRGRCFLSCSADGWSPSQCLAAGLEPGQDTPLAESIFFPKVSQQFPVPQLLCCFSPVPGVLPAARGSTARASHLASTFPPPISFQPPSLHPHAPA